MDKEKVLSGVSKLFEQDFGGHDIWHTLRVTELAVRLAREEGADEDTVWLASMLHDADDKKLSPETSDNKDNAREIMRSIGADEALVESVCGIIGEVSFRGKDSVVPPTIEGKCVQDADRLDALGAVGIARTFAYGGSHGRPICVPGETYKKDMSEAEYRSRESSSIAHFYEKLFLLKDMMNTPSAKRIAEERDAFMHYFMKEFFDEWAGKR